jgi:hypothetical protein
MTSTWTVDGDLPSPSAIFRQLRPRLYRLPVGPVLPLPACAARTLSSCHAMPDPSIQHGCGPASPARMAGECHCSSVHVRMSSGSVLMKSGFKVGAISRYDMGMHLIDCLFQLSMPHVVPMNHCPHHAQGKWPQHTKGSHCRSGGCLCAYLSDQRDYMWSWQVRAMTSSCCSRVRSMNLTA